MKMYLFGAALALALAPAAANATTFFVGSPNFQLDDGETAFDPLITATFKNSVTTGAFDDSFKFVIPNSGTGSGSVSTSFSGAKTKLIITKVLVNGVSIPVSEIFTLGKLSGYSAGITDVPITAFVMNTIEIIGKVTGTRGTYSGTATFEQNAVPEPASWAMLIGGVGVLGGALRRRRAVAVSYS